MTVRRQTQTILPTGSADDLPDLPGRARADRETEAAQVVKMTFAADSGVMEHERQNDVSPQEQAG
jgi:hypothetical protein